MTGQADTAGRHTTGLIPPAEPPRTAERRRVRITGPRVAPYVFVAPFFVLFAIFWVFPVCGRCC